MPIIVGILALVVIVAAFIAYRLVTSGGHHQSTAEPTGTASAVSPSAPSSQSASPTSAGSRKRAVDLADQVASVTVPGTAPPGVDLRGNPVSFGKENLLDGDPSTAWRVAGDASGRTVTLRFDAPVTLKSVGLINGYAKEYPGYNGYSLNRKITAVRWTFDDGTTVNQSLARRTTMQTVPVHAGPTRSVRLEIVSTVPSNRPGARDYTAISELSLVGSPH